MAENESKSPAFRNPADSHEWLGTVPADPRIQTKLTVLHWFIERPSRAQSTSRDNASMFYLGEFYDNVESDLHGQSTRGSAFVKKSFNVDFPETQRFKWREGEPRCARSQLDDELGRQGKVPPSTGL